MPFTEGEEAQGGSLGARRHPLGSAATAAACGAFKAAVGSVGAQEGRRQEEGRVLQPLLVIRRFTIDDHHGPSVAQNRARIPCSCAFERRGMFTANTLCHCIPSRSLTSQLMMGPLQRMDARGIRWSGPWTPPDTAATNISPRRAMSVARRRSIWWPSHADCRRIPTRSGSAGRLPAAFWRQSTADWAFHPRFLFVGNATRTG